MWGSARLSVNGLARLEPLSTHLAVLDRLAQAHHRPDLPCSTHPLRLSRELPMLSRETDRSDERDLRGGVLRNQPAQSTALHAVEARLEYLGEVSQVLDDPQRSSNSHAGSTGRGHTRCHVRQLFISRLIKQRLDFGTIGFFGRCAPRVILDSPGVAGDDHPFKYRPVVVHCSSFHFSGLTRGPSRPASMSKCFRHCQSLAQQKRQNTGK